MKTQLIKTFGICLIFGTLRTNCKKGDTGPQGTAGTNGTN
jgi:hypothetical protein